MKNFMKVLFGLVAAVVMSDATVFAMKRAKVPTVAPVFTSTAVQKAYDDLMGADENTSNLITILGAALSNAAVLARSEVVVKANLILDWMFSDVHGQIEALGEDAADQEIRGIEIVFGQLQDRIATLILVNDRSKAKDGCEALLVTVNKWAESFQAVLTSVVTEVQMKQARGKKQALAIKQKDVANLEQRLAKVQAVLEKAPEQLAKISQDAQLLEARYAVYEKRLAIACSRAEKTQQEVAGDDFQ